MPNLNITKPELVWPGKYDESGKRVVNRGAALPFQVIETIREGRATRAAGGPDLFAFANQKNEAEDSDTWHNKLIWGDNLLVMSSLLQQYAGKIDLIYIDPPFATGADFSYTTDVGEEHIPVKKEQNPLEVKAYNDTWGKGDSSFLPMLYDRLTYMHQLLSPSGSMFLHCDWHVGHYIKVICDEIFGRDNLLNEIAWCYTGPGSPGMRQFSRKHDTIYWYRKSDKWCFNDKDARIPHHEKTKENFKKGLEGSGFVADTYALDQTGKIAEDWWQIAVASRYPADGVKRTGYATEKPWPLIERIVKVASSPGNLVADIFCGSGITAAVAEQNDRRWITADLGRFAIHTTRKRLLGVPECKPFQILNLGQYERKHWQGVTFGKPSTEPEAMLIAEYVRFILELYQAQPCPGFRHIHGRKGRTLITVGAVDAPVTITQVNEAVTECAAAGQKELHILGWEWEMGMNDPIIKQAKASHEVNLRLLTIPREVMEKRAVECGDIRFFDVAYLNAEIAPQDKARRKVRIELKKFAIPDTDLIPEEVRQKITKWSDYVDYWAVDWDYRRDTFMNQWQTYRTRTDRKLALVSSEHEYNAAGKYEILVKVVDIFGNDTSLLLEWKAK